jgi:hemoglobin
MLATVCPATLWPRKSSSSSSCFVVDQSIVAGFGAPKGSSPRVASGSIGWTSPSPSRVAPLGRLRGVADPTPTIYAWAGERPAFERWLNVFYDLVEQDELLATLFDGRVSEEHRDHVTTWWCEVMGGPARYTDELGGYEHMIAKHRGVSITPERRLRFVTLLSRAADEAGLPADPELRAALIGYAEWGTRIAMHNVQPGADVPEHAPVPRWGWGVAPPWTPPG